MDIRKFNLDIVSSRKLGMQIEHSKLCRASFIVKAIPHSDGATKEKKRQINNDKANLKLY